MVRCRTGSLHTTGPYPTMGPHCGRLELKRCADKGAHAFAFSENPEPLGLPTIHDPSGYWDPVMHAANDLDMVVCMHVGSSSTVPQIASNVPPLASLTWGANRTSGAMLSWLFSSYLQDLSNLKICLSEGNIGWIPYFLRAGGTGARQATLLVRPWSNGDILGEPRDPRPERDQSRRPHDAQRPVHISRPRLRLLHR